MGGGWVIEIDIRKFFTTTGHDHLRDFLRRRVHDSVLLRLIGKWLNAGVLEDGCITRPEEGRPQGGVISPIFANVDLHEVLDVWFDREVRRRLSGEARVIRYADDALLLFANEEDARRVMAVLPKRFGRYGLTLHPEKTRLVEFRRPDRRTPSRTEPGTFDLLGFTHFWGVAHSGKWIVKRNTAKDRSRRALKRLADWCIVHLHDSVETQWRTLGGKLGGHFGYYGIVGNFRAIARFREEARRGWQKWLNRRSQRGSMRWDRMQRLLERYPLPRARIRPFPLRAANP
jgi:RNA-directed DNA polymerase